MALILEQATDEWDDWNASDRQTTPEIVPRQSTSKRTLSISPKMVSKASFPSAPMCSEKFGPPKGKKLARVEVKAQTSVACLTGVPSIAPNLVEDARKHILGWEGLREECKVSRTVID